MGFSSRRIFLKTIKLEKCWFGDVMEWKAHGIPGHCGGMGIISVSEISMKRGVSQRSAPGGYARGLHIGRGVSGQQTFVPSPGQHEKQPSSGLESPPPPSLLCLGVGKILRRSGPHLAPTWRSQAQACQRRVPSILGGIRVAHLNV